MYFCVTVEHISLLGLHASSYFADNIRHKYNIRPIVYIFLKKKQIKMREAHASVRPLRIRHFVGLQSLTNRVISYRTIRLVDRRLHTASGH